jgi:hypothetical protein
MIAVKFPWQPPRIETDMTTSVFSSMKTFIMEEQMPFGMYSYETMMVFT